MADLILMALARFGLALRAAPATLGPSSTMAARSTTVRAATSVLCQSKSSMPKQRPSSFIQVAFGAT